MNFLIRKQNKTEIPNYKIFKDIFIFLDYCINFLKLNYINEKNNLRGLKKLKLINNKILKIMILPLVSLFKYILYNLLFIIKNFIYFFFYFIFDISNYIINIISKFESFEKIFHNVLNRINTIKKIFIFKSFFMKRRSIINPRLRKKRLKFISKKSFKKKLIRHIEYTKKIKLKNIQKYMLMRKLKKKKSINSNLRSNSFLISKYIFNFLKFEHLAFDVINTTNNKFSLFIYKTSYILYNITKILNVFNSNKQISYIYGLFNLILNKLNIFESNFEKITTHLNIIRNIDQLFKLLFFKKIVYLMKKKNKKRYFKEFKIIKVFQFSLVLFSIFKIILLINLLLNKPKIKIFMEKFDVFFNLEEYIKQYITHVNFI